MHIVDFCIGKAQRQWHCCGLSGGPTIAEAGRWVTSSDEEGAGALFRVSTLDLANLTRTP